MSAQNFETEIRSILSQQQDCWNKGDIDCFMVGYWESDDLRFMGKNGITRGFEATKARYKKSYPDQSAMGTLNFDILSVEKISRNQAILIGKWHLDRETEDLEGHFSLLWKKIEGEWLIVLDHSS